MVVAERPLLGYPDCIIELDLEFSPDEYLVRITDPVGFVEWHPESREQAKDMFFHPFAYGYTYTVDNIVDDE